MPFDGSPGYTQRVGDLLIAEALHDEPEDVDLAWAQRRPVEFPRHTISNAARKVGVSRSHAPDCFQQLQVRHSFQQVRLRASRERLANVFVTMIGRKHDHRALRAFRPNHLGGLDAAHPRHS